MPSAPDRRFTVPEDVLLAGCVSKHRCLYDKDHMYHGNWEVKERLWAEIAKTLDRSVYDMGGPHTPPGSPPPSPIPEGEDYSGRQVMVQPVNNPSIVVVAMQNPPPGAEGFSSEGQIAPQMTPRTNQKYLFVNQPLLPAASGSSIFHGRPETSRSQNRSEPKNGPPKRLVKQRPQQFRGTKREYRSPSNLRNRKEKREQMKNRKTMLKQQVMESTWLKCDNSHVATNPTFRESVAYTPSIPTTSSAAAGVAPQTPEECVDDTGSASKFRKLLVDRPNE